MQFWSKGLGKRNMNIACGSETPEVKQDAILLHGTVKPPLNWQYTITMQEEDWLAFFEVAFHPVILKYLLKPKRWRVLFAAGVQLFLFFAKYLLILPFARMKAIPQHNLEAQKVQS